MFFWHTIQGNVTGQVLKGILRLNSELKEDRKAETFFYQLYKETKISFDIRLIEKKEVKRM